MMEIIQTLRPTMPMDCVATVLESRWLTPTIKAIRLRLDQPDFSFLPGQAIWPKFEREGRQFSKIYSMSSSPSNCPEVELCVSRVGWSSAYMQDIPVGGTIAARGPYGLLTLDRLPLRSRLYLAEGSGIAPIKSQLDWLYEAKCPYPLWLVQANPETADRLPYADELETLSQIWPQFHYVPVTQVTPENVVAQLGLDLAQFDVDICAVNRRTIELQHCAIALGTCPQRIRFETFHSF